MRVMVYDIYNYHIFKKKNLYVHRFLTYKGRFYSELAASTSTVRIKH